MPIKFSGNCLSSWKGFARQLIAFAFLFSDGEQPHARTPRAEHAAEINFAHDRELFQVLRLAIDIGADVEQDGNRTHGGGKNRGQRRTIHSGYRSEHHFRRGHRRARIARSHETGSAAFAHQPCAHANGGVTLGADRLYRLVIHGDDFAGVHDFNRQSCGGRVASQFGSQLIFVSD